MVFLPRWNGAGALNCSTVGSSTDPSTTDDDEPANPTADCGSVQGDLKRYLLDAGYDENAAAGLLGNISAESCTFKVNVYHNCSTFAEDDFRAYTNGVRNSKLSKNDGFGLVQWTPDNDSSKDRLLALQNYADSLGKGITKLEVQAKFILEELTTTRYNSYYSKALAPSKANGKTIEETTWRFLRYYESPRSLDCVGTACCASASDCPASKQNAQKPPTGYGSAALAELTQNSDKYQLAYSSYANRLSRAKDLLSLDVSNCRPAGEDDGDDGDDDGDDGGDPSDVPTIEDPDDGDDGGDTIQTTGALGAKNSDNVISQTDSSVKNTQWILSSGSGNKKIGVNDDGSCCGSGCSLIAVANAYGTLKGYNKSKVAETANSLAAWSKTAISAPGESNMLKLARKLGLSTQQIWSSKSTSSSTKIAAIRTALASGKAIVAGGDRKETRGDTNFCKTGNHLANGDCVFTPGGHYIAIIGITADDKLVVANPGKSPNRKWIFPAATVLQYSNFGYAVK